MYKVNKRGPRTGPTKGDALGPSSQVGLEPAQGQVTETNSGVQTVQEDGMIYCLKRCR